LLLGVKGLLEQNSGVNIIESIKGAGDLGAGILLSVIGDVEDLANEGKLASYFGIIPRLSNSNERLRSERITKRGSKLGRTSLLLSRKA